MVKEKKIENLYRLGFTPGELDNDMGYRFDFESMNLLYTAEDDDANSVTFIMPGIFDISEENRVAVLDAMFKLCAKMKFTQQYEVVVDEDKLLQELNGGSNN